MDGGAGVVAMETDVARIQSQFMFFAYVVVSKKNVDYRIYTTEAAFNCIPTLTLTILLINNGDEEFSSRSLHKSNNNNN